MANSAVVGILRALLTANTAEFETAMKRASNSAQAFSKDTKQIGQQATALGASLTKTLTLPIVGVGGAVAKFAMDFESSFAGVRKTVQASEPEFAALAQTFRDLAKTIPIDVNELNRLGEAAGALGIPKQSLADFARVMALVGVTTNVTADQAAESIAKIQNIFGAAGKDTERFASTLVALGNDGASTEEQILSMATRIAGAGNAIGMSQGQVLAFASALSSVGIEAEMGGSAISRVFIEMASAVSKGGDEIAGFAKVAGKPIKEFAQLFKDDAATAVNEFIKGLSRIKDSGGNLIGTLEQLGFTEIRVRDTLLRAAGAGDLLTKALDLQEDAWRKNSALTDEAAKRFETTRSQLTLLWNRVKDVGITLGNALLPMIKATVGAVETLIPVVEFLAKIFVALPVPVQAVGIGLLAVLAAAGPVIFAFGQLAIAASALTGAFTTTGIATRGLAASMGVLRTAMAFLSGPGLIIGGLIAVGAALNELTKGIAKLPPGLQQVQDKLDKIKKTSDDIVRPRDVMGFMDPREAQEQNRRPTAAPFDPGLGDGDADAKAGKKRWAEIMAELASAGADYRAILDGINGETVEAIRFYLDAGVAQGVLAEAYGLTATQIKAVAASLSDIEAEKKAAQTLREMGFAARDAEQTMRLLGETGAQSGKMITDAFGDALLQMQAYTAIDPKQFKFDLSALFDMGNIAPPNMKDFKQTFGTVFAEIGASVPTLLMKAFTGGGGLKGAINALGVSISDGLFGEKGALSGAMGAAKKGLSKIFGDTLGGAFAAAIPGIGALIGPALQALWGGIKKIFGGPSEEELAGREVKKAFQDSFGSFEEMLGAVDAAYRATGRSSEQARRDVERLMAAEKEGAEAVKKVMAEINVAFEEQKTRWEGVQESVADLNAFVADGVGELGRYNIASASAVAIFEAWVQKTGDVAGALQQIGPALDAIATGQTELGIEGDAAINQLLGLRKVTEANKPLMEQIGQSTRLMKSLGKAGLLTKDLLISFGQNAVNQFTVLKSKTGDARTAMVLMQPELQALWEHQQKFGSFADEATEALVNQAREAGIVGPEMKSEQQQLLDVMRDIRDTLYTIAGIKIPDKTFNVTPNVSPIVVPTIPGGPSGGGTGDGTGGGEDDGGRDERLERYARGGWVQRLAKGGLVQHLAGGGYAWPKPMGTDTVRAMLTPGEFVLDHNRLNGVVAGLEAGAEITRNLAALDGAGRYDAAMLAQLRAIEDAILSGRVTSVQVNGREIMRANVATLEKGEYLTEFREVLGVS